VLGTIINAESEEEEESYERSMGGDMKEEAML
jgi:hypothetical protein